MRNVSLIILCKEVNVQAVMMSSWDFSRLSRSVRNVRMESFQVSAISDFVELRGVWWKCRNAGANGYW